MVPRKHNAQLIQDREEYPLILRLVAVIGVLIFAGVTIWHGLTDVHEARASVDWPTVDGKVLSHAVHRQSHTHSRDTFAPIVWYEYRVGDTPYKDSRLSWYAENFDSERAAQDFMQERFPVGATVRVHYDSVHPHHACLIPGGAKQAMVPIYAAGMMVVVMLVVCVIQLFRRRRFADM